MILIRHEAAEGGMHRVVLLGRLERGDAAGLAAVPDAVPAGVEQVRLLLAKLWPEGPAPVADLVALGDALAASGRPPVFVGADADLTGLLRAGTPHPVVGPSPADVRALAAWTGTPLPALIPAPRAARDLESRKPSPTNG